LATRLYYNDPDVLTALMDDKENTITGYEMEALMPAIRCPVLLLQADPDAGGLMPDDQVARALSLLAQGRHVRLEGVDHTLFHPCTESTLLAITGFSESLSVA
jgi:pimeloyl-ACP methyl ester carboxylesterase